MKSENESFQHIKYDKTKIIRKEERKERKEGILSCLCASNKT